MGEADAAFRSASSVQWPPARGPAQNGVGMSGVMDLVAAAKATIENLGTEQVAAEMAGEDVVLVDLREPTETVNGVIPGALTAPRGMLEFHADPTTPYHIDGLDPSRRTIVYCASGGRSALAVRTLEAMGYRNVAHLDGGINAWVAEDRPVQLPGEAG